MSIEHHHDEGIALWRRVANAIERGIADGVYAPGEKLPSENEIADSHGVNRHTVRRAIAMLAERGLVRAERGSGTYVEAQRISYPLRSRTRFSEIVGQEGREPRGRLLASGVEEANRELARRLGVKAGTPLAWIETLRFADRAPICVGTNWFEAARFPDVAEIYERTRTMTALLAHYDIRNYRRTWTRIRAAVADATDCARLDIALGRSVLVVDSTDVDGDGRPVVTKYSRFAAERVEFIVDT